MRIFRAAVALGCCLGLSITGVSVASAQPNKNSSSLERQVLADGDGWGSATTGTSGGAAADPSRVYDISTRAELLDALTEAGDEPKIVRVHGTVQFNADDQANPLSCDDLAAQVGFSLQDYLDTYDPQVWGTETEPTGPVEDLRAAAARLQSQLITVKVPSNTTIIGADPQAGIVGGTLRVEGVDNVIIRNLTMSDTYDCFPSWDPTDGAEGNWNSEYDSIQIINQATHVWVDHMSFTDAPMFDDQLPSYFGREYQRHDGALDITNGSDYVTVSYNSFADHDKLMLIGSTDSTGRGDPGHLRVSVHHNLFTGVGQRAPRVRYGQVDVYNNHYVISDDQAHVDYVYSIGVGKDSQIVAENNAFDISGDIDPGSILGWYRGTSLYASGNVVNGHKADLVSLHNESVDASQQLVNESTWTPTLRSVKMYPGQAVTSKVDRYVGPQYTLS